MMWNAWLHPIIMPKTVGRLTWPTDLLEREQLILQRGALYSPYYLARVDTRTA